MVNCEDKLDITGEACQCGELLEEQRALLDSVDTLCCYHISGHGQNNILARGSGGEMALLNEG